jgi:hypothetical protein
MPLRIRVEFSQGNREVKVRLYTSSLRRIREFEFPDSLWAGVRTLDIPASAFDGLANGSYFYIISAENNARGKARSGIPSVMIIK